MIRRFALALAIAVPTVAVVAAVVASLPRPIWSS
jgi:hypothetical protein